MRVLIVDDCDELRQVLRAILDHEAGIDVLEAASAEDGLEVLTREDVDLVVMDHSLPGMTGLECIRRLCARPGAPECVAFTSMPDGEASFLAAGATRHFSKADVDPLLEFLRQRAEVRERDGYRVAE